MTTTKRVTKPASATDWSAMNDKREKISRAIALWDGLPKWAHLLLLIAYCLFIFTMLALTGAAVTVITTFWPVLHHTGGVPTP